MWTGCNLNTKCMKGGRQDNIASLVYIVTMEIAFFVPVFRPLQSISLYIFHTPIQLVNYTD